MWEIYFSGGGKREREVERESRVKIVKELLGYFTR